MHLLVDFAPGRYQLVAGVELIRWAKKKPIEVKLKALFWIAGSN